MSKHLYNVYSNASPFDVDLSSESKDNLFRRSCDGNDKEDISIRLSEFLSSDNSDMDWDAELGISNTVEPSQFHCNINMDDIDNAIDIKSPKSTYSDSSESSLAPIKYKIMSHIIEGYDDINIVRYPIPSELFSCKLNSNGRKQMSARELEEWLLNTSAVFNNMISVNEVKVKDWSWLNHMHSMTSFNCKFTKVMITYGKQYLYLISSSHVLKIICSSSFHPKLVIDTSKL